MSITLKGLGSAVDSVNGKTGIVVLSPEDLGADSAGAASAVIVQHEAAADPHPQYLTENEADAKYALIGSGGAGGDPAGTAAALLAAHEAAADPHPQYLTQSEGDALYQPIGSGGGTSELIRTPVAVAPLTGTTEFPVDGTLQASPYAPLYSADAREFREFQIDTATGDFTAPISVAQVNADTWAISPAIPDNTDLQWRCRDKSVAGDYSNWSQPQSFQTFDIYVVTPSFIYPAQGESVPERDAPILTSDFQIVNSQDTHIASYWLIKNNLGAVVYSTGRDTVNLTSWQPPLGVIIDGMSMIVEVYYESSGGFFSQPASINFVGASAAYGNYLSVAHNTAPRISVYGRDVDTFNKLLNPATLPTSDAYSTKISKGGKYIPVGTLSSPYLYMYKRTGDEIAAISGPSVSTTINGIDFNSNDTIMALAASASPFLRLYSISNDIFTPITAPTTVPTARANGVAISADNAYMAVCFEVDPYVLVYKDSGSGFKNLPGALSQNPPNNSTGVSFSNDSQYLAVSHATAPFVTIYKRTGDSFTKLTDPTITPTGTGRSVSFSASANYLAVGHSTSPFISIYSRSGDTFTKITNPTTLPPGQGNGVSFILNGEYLAVAHTTTPFLSVYKNAGGVFSKLPNPSTTPTGTGNSCSFYPSV